MLLWFMLRNLVIFNNDTLNSIINHLNGLFWITTNRILGSRIKNTEKIPLITNKNNLTHFFLSGLQKGGVEIFEIEN